MTTNPPRSKDLGANAPMPKEEYLCTLDPLSELEVTIFTRLRFPIYSDPDSGQQYLHRGWFRNTDDMKRNIVVRVRNTLRDNDNLPARADAILKKV